MNSNFKRILEINLPCRQSAFLWGPRKVGKSTYLKQKFPDSLRYDFLKSDLHLEMLKMPSLLRTRIIAALDSGAIAIEQPIILDEVQRVPALLDEVHYLMEERGCCFLLCGSSARRLKRGHANMLGGRAWRYEMRPLIVAEIPGFDLLRALNHGLIPSHYLSGNARKSISAYVQDYLKEEIIAEGVSRNIPAFTRFMDILGFCNGEMINFASVGRDTGVDAKTVREYFQILCDTLVGSLLPPFAKRNDRNLISKMPKFYLFDVGVAQFLSKTRIEEPRGSAFGKAFEHFILMELQAYLSYREIDESVSYWRTQNGHEVDFVLGNARVAIEVKSAASTASGDLRGLQQFIDAYAPQRAIVVTTESSRRKLGTIDLLPWQDFLEELWGGKIIEQGLS